MDMTKDKSCNNNLLVVALKTILPYFLAVAISIGIIFFFNNYYPIVIVSGHSMDPTLSDGNLLHCTKDISSIDYGDIVVFKQEDARLIKRVIGLPGDTVHIKDGIIYVNDHMTDYSFETIENAGVLKDEVHLSADEYICIGDNRNHSRDCRDFGQIDKDQIQFLVVNKIF